MLAFSFSPKEKKWPENDQKQTFKFDDATSPSSLAPLKSIMAFLSFILLHKFISFTFCHWEIGFLHFWCTLFLGTFHQRALFDLDISWIIHSDDSIFFHDMLGHLLNWNLNTSADMETMERRETSGYCRSRTDWISRKRGDALHEGCAFLYPSSCKSKTQHEASGEDAF